MYRYLLDRLVRIADRNRECEIYVVTRYEKIRTHVEQIQKKGGKIRCVWAPDSEKGASYSVRTGIWAARDTDVSVFFVADQPFLKEESVDGFLRFMKEIWRCERSSSLGSVCRKGVPGNPVWFGSDYYPELERLQGDQGGRRVFCRYPGRVRFYELAGPEELTDLDYRKGGKHMNKYMTGIQHIGIPTRNMDETVGFYQKLGFEIAHQTVNQENGARVVFLKLGNLVIETYEEENVKMEYGSIDHLAIDVTDIDAVYAEICGKGLNNLPDEIHFLPFWENGVRYFKIDGPNKESIEFSQML